MARSEIEKLRHPEIDALIKDIHDHVYDQGRRDGIMDYDLNLFKALMDYVSHDGYVKIKTGEMRELMHEIHERSVKHDG